MLAVRSDLSRLVLHVFFHDTQSSIGLCKNPIMSFIELCFTLPASRDLWTARNPEEWRDLYLAKGPVPLNGVIPQVGQVMHRRAVLETLEAHIDIELCCITILHGFWGQIAAYREAFKFYSIKATEGRETAHHVWMKIQHQELYHDLCSFAMEIKTLRTYDASMVFLSELLMMILHVPPDELQRFAGKYGEEEARSAAQCAEEFWAAAPESRYAVWHAGQVFRHARKLAPTSLRGFNAIAVYFASLTLWTYSLVSFPQPNQGPTEYVLLDGEETMETKAFLQVGRGVPALRVCADYGAEIESLSNPDTLLCIARTVLRDNFPVREEPLPPLVESLGRLLRDLGTGSATGTSPETSEDESDTDAPT